ncbi:hypothetical protein VYU27_004854 [Nannochloropsis oceanica]
MKDFQTMEDNLMVLIDARPAMLAKNADGKSPLRIAFELAQFVLRQKIMMSRRDWVGVVLFGVDKAVDDKSEENGGQAGGSMTFGASQLLEGHTTELQPLGEPTAKRIKQLERLCQPDVDVAKELHLRWTDSSSFTSSSGLRDGFRACLRMLETRSKKERDIRRIWLLTNEDDPSEPNNPSQVIKDAQEGGVDVRLWHFPHPDGRDFDERKLYGPVLSAASKQPFELDYIKADEEETESESKMVNVGSGDMTTLLGAAKGRLFKKRRYACTIWQVTDSPPLSINVALYKTIQPCKKPTPVQLAAATNRRLVPSTKWLCEELVQYIDLELEAAYGLDFGSSNTTVPFKRPEFEYTLRAGLSEPGLYLLGFVPSEELAWELNVTSSTTVYPEELSLKGCTRAFISLREAMLKRERMAVVRYQASAKSEPRLAVLLASLATKGLELVELPFLGDLRSVESPHLDCPPPPPEKEQLEAARKVVARLTLKPQQYSVGFNNPALEKFYSGLQALALEEAKTEWNEITDDSTWPSDELLGRAEEELEELWELSPDPRKGVQRGRGRKRKADAVTKTVKGKLVAEKVSKAEDEDDEKIGGGGDRSVKDLSMGKLAKLTVPQLKEICRARGLPVSGKKGDIIDRLQMDLETDDDL